METRLAFLLSCAFVLGGCAEKMPLVCGGGSVAVDGSCVMLDLGGHDSGTDLGPGDATTDASDAGTDMPDMPLPDLGDLGVDLGPVFMLDPCLQPDGGFAENHLHIEADTSSPVAGGPPDVIGGTWAQSSPAFMANKVTVYAADVRDGGMDASVDLGPYWAVTLGAPSTASSLTAGRYEGAIKSTTTASPMPTMDIAYGGVSCASLNGRFEVQNVAVVSGGGYTLLRATFEETCPGTPASTIRGCIVYSP